MITNPILRTDSYKLSHPWQFPPNTSALFYYAEARKGGRFPETMFFGLQAMMEEYLTVAPTLTEVNEAARFAKLHGLPFDLRGWQLIADLSYFPLRIRAVQEGTQVPAGEVMYTVESTDPRVYWLPGWVETQIMRTWYPSTVATVSWEAKKILWDYLVESSDHPEDFIQSRLHDFGARGVSSAESAALGGMAHLVNFQGTDTMEGIVAAQHYYNATEMPGFSIPGMEHSTVTAWGQSGEADAFANMLDQFEDYPAIAAVSDSYDVYEATSEIWGNKLRRKVKAGASLVIIRPDSGVPWKVVPEVLRRLADAYGETINSKGYRILNNVAVIQGDGMTIHSIPKVLRAVVGAYRFSAENLAFGMGGGLLQQVNRDTQRFAYKLSAAKIDGEWRGVSKNPVGDPSKASKAGRLDLRRLPSGLHTTRIPDGHIAHPESAMRTVFEDGEIKVHQSFDQVRYNAGKVFRESTPEPPKQ